MINNDTPLAQLTVGEFRSLLRDFGPARPPLATQSEAAAALGLSVRSLSNFEQRGMPVLRVNGCAPKYDLASIQAWLSAESARAKAESERCAELIVARQNVQNAEQALSCTRAQAEKMLAENYGSDAQRTQAAAVAERAQKALANARAALATLEHLAPTDPPAGVFSDDNHLVGAPVAFVLD